MDTTAVRVGTADLIAYTFYRLGYRPRESLVLVGLEQPRLQIGLTIRSDLPPASHGAKLPVEAMQGMLREHGQRAVVVLIVSDRPPVGADRGAIAFPYRRLARDLRHRLGRAGYAVPDIIAVGDRRWRSYLCRDPRCCPPEGRPISDVTNSALAARMIADGRVMAADEQSLLHDVAPADGPTPPESPAAAPAAAGDTAPAAGRDARTEVATREASPGPEASPGTEDLLARWLGLLRETGGPAPEVGWLVQALADRRFRDAVLLSLVPDPAGEPSDLLRRAQVTAGTPDTTPGLFDVPPDQARLAQGTSLLAAVARTAPPGLRADALAVLAWAAWWSGDAVRGRLLAARALADRPDHTLAALVGEVLFVGIPPGWVRTAPARHPAS